jgi:hypothetical protein
MVFIRYLFHDGDSRAILAMPKLLPEALIDFSGMSADKIPGNLSWYFQIFYEERFAENEDKTAVLLTRFSPLFVPSQ